MIKAGFYLFFIIAMTTLQFIIMAFGRGMILTDSLSKEMQVEYVKSSYVYLGLFLLILCLGTYFYARAANKSTRKYMSIVGVCNVFYHHALLLIFAN